MSPALALIATLLLQTPASVSVTAAMVVAMAVAMEVAMVVVTAAAAKVAVGAAAKVEATRKAAEAAVGTRRRGDVLSPIAPNKWVRSR